ncbi:hypothetical protein [Radiobacillus sp. PE A8.2]|uniref:hypothetical protein n=1 Tax=Radiobacillus sp. PE A8.2 TaxID=3380349 RepID=UPI003890420A
MIQFVGESEIVFNNRDISINQLKSYLKKSMKKFEIINQELSDQNNRITIHFVFTMSKIYHCRNLDDYVSYAFAEHRKKLPSAARASYVRVFRTSYA